MLLSTVLTDFVVSRARLLCYYPRACLASLLPPCLFGFAKALRGVREEELVQYGMRKGHARLVVRTLAEGFSL